MDKRGNKDFKGWMTIKERIHYQQLTRTISDGEIWWCAVGENVGSEICGKGAFFSRPMLIIRKLSKNNFIGVPLSSQIHYGSWYVDFVFKNKKEYAVVAQVENVSTYRLYTKIGRVPNTDLDKVRQKLCNLIATKKYSLVSTTRAGEYSRKCTRRCTAPNNEVIFIIS